MKKRMLCLGALCLTLLGAAPGIRAQADSTAIRYSALNNPYYTYADLMLAKTRDFSDTAIAKLVKISEESQTRFSVLSGDLARGDTFLMLADRYGVPLSDLDHVQKQKDQVSNYISAYETSGRYAYPDSAK